MKKIEFLATSLPSGLKVNICYFNGCADTKCVKLIGRDLDDDLNGDYKVIPIIRHTDTLTQKCIQADYNNGEPFIPIVELGKLIRNGYWYLDNNGATVADKDLFLFLSATDVDGYFYCEDLNNGNLVSVNQLQLFQQLLKWHYWIDKPENEEVVYVTETFNPYK